MKNPLFTLDRLAELQGEIAFDIFGPHQDHDLLKLCERKIASLPANVSVRLLGPLAPDRVIEELSQRHFFVLPTLGENYGHVIIEGAAAGCPVIISDRTQWLGLKEKGAGWDIALDEVSTWRGVLQSCVDMAGSDYEALSRTAVEFGRTVMNSRSNLEANVERFRRALHSARQSSAGILATGVSR